MGTNSISSSINPQPAHELSPSKSTTRFAKKMAGRINDRDSRVNDKINKLGAQNIRKSYETTPSGAPTQLPVNIAIESSEIGAIREGLRKQNSL